MTLDRNTNAIPDLGDVRPKWVVKNRFNGKIPSLFWSKASKSSAALILRELKGKEFLKPLESKTFRNELFERVLYFFICPNTLIERKNTIQNFEYLKYKDNKELKCIKKNQEDIGIQVDPSLPYMCTQYSQTKSSFLESALDILGYKNHPRLNKKWLKLLDKKEERDYPLSKKEEEKILLNQLLSIEKDISETTGNCDMPPSINEKSEKEPDIEDIISSKISDIENHSLLAESLKEKSISCNKVKEVEKSKRNFKTVNKKSKKKSHSSMNVQYINLEKECNDFTEADEVDISISVDMTCKTEMNDKDCKWAIAIHKNPEKNEISTIPETNTNHNSKDIDIQNCDAMTNDSKLTQSSTGNHTYTAYSPIRDFNDGLFSDIESDIIGKDVKTTKSPISFRNECKFQGRYKNKRIKSFSITDPPATHKKEMSMKKPPLQTTENEVARHQFFITDIKSAKENLIEPIKDRRAMRLIKRYNSSVRVISSDVKQNNQHHFAMEITAPSKRQLNWLARDFNKLFPKWNLQSQLAFK